VHFWSVHVGTYAILPLQVQPFLVRKYVEGLNNDSAQLLDLLSATSGDDIEPTPAHPASRQALYPDVTFLYPSVFSFSRIHSF
jgi:hypothetical protein